MGRLRGLAARRWLRFVLLPLFLPLVVVTQTGAAHAAPVVVATADDVRVSDSASIKLKQKAWGSYSVTCNWVHSVVGGVYAIQAGAYCQANPWSMGGDV